MSERLHLEHKIDKTRTAVKQKGASIVVPVFPMQFCAKKRFSAELRLDYMPLDCQGNRQSRILSALRDVCWRSKINVNRSRPYAEIPQGTPKKELSPAIR